MMQKSRAALYQNMKDGMCRIATSHLSIEIPNMVGDRRATVGEKLKECKQGLRMCRLKGVRGMMSQTVLYKNVVEGMCCNATSHQLRYKNDRGSQRDI